MIRYTTSVDHVTPKQLVGFFVGWPDPPSPETHLRILKASQIVVLAFDTGTNQVVGFATALTDGILSAYLPLLEVLPSHQGHGIGTQLLRRVLDQLKDLYMVDLSCDATLQPFYARFGLVPSTGMSLRNYGQQSGRSNQHQESS